jgi:hypothetical protein
MVALRESLPRWRKRIFWSFQLMFWLAIGAAVLGLSKALKPAEPTPWLPMALRVGTGFAISTLVYFLFESPLLRGLPRQVRWPLMAGVAPAVLLASILLLIAAGVGGPSNWTGETTLGPLLPRLIAAEAWCLIVFGLELIEDLYRAKILLAENEATAIDVEKDSPANGTSARVVRLMSGS